MLYVLVLPALRAVLMAVSVYAGGGLYLQRQMPGLAHDVNHLT